MSLIRKVAALACAGALLPGLASAQALLPFHQSTGGEEGLTVTVFADGAARTALTDDPGDGATGTGALGLRIRSGSRWTLGANVAVVSSADTLNRGFGTAVLTPAGGSNPSGLLDLLISDIDRLGGLDLHAYTSFSQSLWSGTEGTETVGVLGLGVLVSESFGGVDSAQSAYYGIRIEAGLSYRSIGGDISDADQLRTELLGTDNQEFGGFEGGVQLQAGNVGAGFQAFYLFNIGDDTHVEGLTRLQLTFGLRVEGAIFSRALTR